MRFQLGSFAGRPRTFAADAFGNERVLSAFDLHDMPAMRQADDDDLRQELSMRTLPRDRHRVCSRLEIPVAEDHADEESR
jgi:hypothetical protein